MKGYKNLSPQKQKNLIQDKKTKRDQQFWNNKRPAGLGRQVKENNGTMLRKNFREDVNFMCNLSQGIK